MDSTLESRTRPSLLLAVRDPSNGRAWEAFTQRYEGIIRGWCRRKGLRPEDVDEVTQVVLFKLFQEMPTFVYDPRKPLPQLAARVVANAVADYWRGRRRHPGDWGSGDTGVREALEGVPAPAGANFEEMVQELEEQMERARQVREACEQVRKRVNDRTWRAFWLTAIEGRKGTEVAGLLVMDVAAVHMAKSRVIKMIREECGRLSKSEGAGEPRNGA